MHSGRRLAVVARPSIEQQITFLYTGDLAEISRFYEEILGLPLKLDQGNCRIYQVSRDGYVGFCQQEELAEDARARRTRRIILTLVTPEVDEWHRYLVERGVVFEKPPAINPKYQIYHCFLRDPDGNLIEIQRFLHAF
jgi:catechol 2,3-dioxygenase-like lactoylglutathione lyase family enzyme